MSWDKIFQEKEWGRYPPIELVQFIARNYYDKNRAKTKILDAGCGTGACTWYLAREGFDTYGIDGSQKGVAIAKNRLYSEKLEADFYIGNLTDLPYDNNYFDCVVGVVALTHNSLVDIKKIVSEYHRVLKKGGKLFVILFAEGTTAFKSSKGGIELYGVELTIHLFKENELERVFNPFKLLEIERISRTVGNREKLINQFTVVGEKC